MASTSKQKKPKLNWDLDYYRTDHESEEHWLLRRRFMEVHMDKFPEDKLVCLAQVFTNVEFMGCRYPAETMRLVAELSKDIAKEFRDKRAKRLKRTFVTASDAAEARAKGRRTTQQEQPRQQQQHQQHRGNNSGLEKNTRFNNYNEPPLKSAKTTDLFERLPYGKFVLFLSGGRNCLRTSAQRCNMEYKELEVGSGGEKKKVEIYLNDKLVTYASEENLKASKAKAFSNAMELMQKNCYSIKLNPLRDSIKIDKTDNKVVCGVTKNIIDSAEDKKLDDTNKGYKMMKMMGWTGGGLGSKTQGREDPVGYLLKNNRAGLGNEASKLDRSYFSHMLKNYINSEDIRELQFECTFTKDERAILHEIAGKFNLKSTSYGKGDDRRLVISKKTITNEQILTEILLNQNAVYSDKYFVQVPETKASLYPDHTAVLELDP